MRDVRHVRSSSKTIVIWPDMDAAVDISITCECAALKPSNSTRPYYSEKGASTEFYDLVTAADQALVGDIDIYAGMIPEGGAVLELGAGTGRVALELAARGRVVTGLDIAPAMLTQAEAKRSQLAPEVAERVNFVRGDMTSFALDQTYDTIICTFYALAHLPVGAAWRNTFQAVAKHLRPGGVAAFHLPLALKMGATPPPSDHPVMLQSMEDGRTLAMYVAEQTMREKVGRMDLTLRYSVSGPGGRRDSLERLTLYTGDPAPFAAAVGLQYAEPPIDLGGVGLVHVFQRQL